MGETCATCRFWRDGFCKRHAPKLFVVYYNEEPNWEAGVPGAAADDWCGEHQPRDDAGPQPASDTGENNA